MKGLRTIITACIAVAFVAMAILASAALAQSRGSARLSGKVVDEQGQPVEGVTVKAQMSGQTEIMSGRSDKKGEWRINDLANGEWKVELAKPELGTVTEVVEIRGNDAPALNVTLKKAEAKVDPRAEVDAELKRAADLAQGGKLPEARKIYEDLLVKYPDIFQLEGFIARTYAAENNIPAALQHLKVNLEKEPDNVDLKLLQADLLMESGDKVAAKALLDSIDITKAKDPYTFINEAIILVNEKKGQEAVDLLTKLIAQFPTTNELYYYRGRAYVVAEKLDEARADLEKFVTLAPTAKETADAKKILEQLKK
jgi:tetratricopeptide (TPR) repeat protein